MLVGIILAIVSAIIFKNEISIHKWFNHMDLSHVLMASGAYFFYRGAIYFQEGLSVK